MLTDNPNSITIRLFRFGGIIMVDHVMIFSRGSQQVYLHQSQSHCNPKSREQLQLFIIAKIMLESTQNGDVTPCRGLYNLTNSSVTDSPKVLMWHLSNTIGVVFVCDKNENTILASNVLESVVLRVTALINSSDIGTVMKQPEDLQLILSRFLVNGRLVFYNHSLMNSTI